MPVRTVHPRTGPGFAVARQPAPWCAEPGRGAAQRRVVLVISALVLLVHALLLGGWPAGPGPSQRVDAGLAAPPLRVVHAVQAVQTVQTVHAVRLAAAAPTPSVATVVGVAAPSDTAQPRRAVPVARRDAQTQVTTQVTTQNSTQDSTQAASPLVSAAPVRVSPSAQAPAFIARPAAEVAADAQPAPPDTADPAAGLRVPTYATRLPPSTTLQFALRRGASTGRAELAWQTEGGRYQLQMRGQVLAAPQLAWRSEGAIDAHGIAPDRYGEWRRGRELRAANFQRVGGDGAGAGAADADRITFSGPQVQAPLLAGAQDRISWMLQLPAVLAANPALQAPGSTVQLFVAGARGDAQVWTFTVLGTKALALADGNSIGSTLHLQRVPSRPYDTRVDIWLDPARAHLPVRALLTVQPGGDSTEFLLERTPPP